MLIRRAVPEDGAAFLAMMRQLDCETRFMMYEPDERKATVEDMARELRRVDDGGGLTLLVEDEAGRITGFLSAERGFARRIRHVVSIVVGLLPQVRGQGTGIRLFQALETWAREQGVTRLELTVMTQNYAAVRLYEKMGFIVEGYREQAMFVDGQFVNEFYMARLLNPAAPPPGAG